MSGWISDNLYLSTQYTSTNIPASSVSAGYLTVMVDCSTNGFASTYKGGGANRVIIWSPGSTSWLIMGST